MRKIIGLAAPVAAMLGSTLVMAGAASASAPHLQGCNESRSVRPARFNPICNDGSYTVIGLHWRTWSGTADGSGEFYTHQRDYPIQVAAWRPRNGSYTRFRYQFTHHAPPAFPRSWTIRYYSGRWHGLVV
jgi:hypothetical protein